MDGIDCENGVKADGCDCETATGGGNSSQFQHEPTDTSSLHYNDIPPLTAKTKDALPPSPFFFASVRPYAIESQNSTTSPQLPSA